MIVSGFNNYACYHCKKRLKAKERAYAIQLFEIASSKNREVHVDTEDMFLYAEPVVTNDSENICVVHFHAVCWSEIAGDKYLFEKVK